MERLAVSINKSESQMTGVMKFCPFTNFAFFAVNNAWCKTDEGIICMR